MGCFSAELGTLVFAIINIGTVVFSSAASIGSLIFWCAMNIPVDTGMKGHDIVMTFAELAGIFGWMSASFVALLFSSFLLNGIIKKKPEHIKVYFIYGVVCAVLSLFMLISTFVFFHYFNFLILLAIYLVYCLVLYMVNYTYRNMALNQQQFSHKPLNNYEPVYEKTQQEKSLA